MRDAWGPVRQKSCHHLGYANDSLDKARDNIALRIHPDRPKLLLMVLTRDVQADEQGFVPYGGTFFCNDKYPLNVLIKAVHRYEINVRSSTEDINGNWKELALYEVLLAACPPTDVTTKKKKRKERRPLTPAGNNQKKQNVRESFFFCPPASSFSKMEAVEMVVADDSEPEPGRRAAARIATELRNSATCMMMCDDDVATVVFFYICAMCAR